VEIQHKLQRDNRAAEGARRGHLVETGNLAELALEWRGDRRSHDVRAGPGIERQNLNGGIIHLRQCRDGQLLVGDKARQEQTHHQQAGGNRTQDERAGRTHLVLPGADKSLAGGGRASTLLPSCSLSWPSITTVSLGSSPALIPTAFPDSSATVTGRILAVLVFATTYT